MKKLFCILAMLAFVGVSASAQTERAPKPAAKAPAPVVEASKGAPAKAKAGKSVKGDVVSVMTYCGTGKAPKLTKEEASMMAKRGEVWCAFREEIISGS